MLALALFAIFTLSPTPGAAHGCDAWLRTMVMVACPEPEFPSEWTVCPRMAPPMPVPCAVTGNEAYALTQPLPGQAFWFCIFAENSIDRSGCAEPVEHL